MKVDEKKVLTQKNENFGYSAGIFMSVTKIILCNHFMQTIYIDSA